MINLNIDLEPIQVGRQRGCVKMLGYPAINVKLRDYSNSSSARFTFYQEAVDHLNLQENDRVILWKGIAEEAWYLHILSHDNKEPGYNLFLRGHALCFQSEIYHKKGIPEGTYCIGEPHWHEQSKKTWYPLTWRSE